MPQIQEPGRELAIDVVGDGLVMRVQGPTTVFPILDVRAIAHSGTIIAHEVLEKIAQFVGTAQQTPLDDIAGDPPSKSLRATGLTIVEAIKFFDGVVAELSREMCSRLRRHLRGEGFTKLRDELGGLIL